MGERAKEKRKDLRDETILFKVTKREKDAIEEFVKAKKGWTVSEYIRVAVLFDMIASGDLKTLSIVSGTVKDHLGEKMRALFSHRPELLETEDR